MFTYLSILIAFYISQAALCQLCQVGNRQKLIVTIASVWSLLIIDRMVFDISIIRYCVFQNNLSRITGQLIIRNTKNTTMAI